MKVEHIKREMLAEHTALRHQLDIISALVEVPAEETFREEALREASHELAAALVHHMESEEQHLASLSRGGHPHWARHFNEFKHHHVHQRTLLAHFLERVNAIHSSRRLGEFVDAMATAIRLDMEQEERALFAQEPKSMEPIRLRSA